MNWEKFKRQLRNDTQQQRVDVDVNAIWNAIEPQVDELNQSREKRKKRFFWIFFAGALLTGIGLAAFYSNTNTDKTNTVDKNTEAKPYAVESSVRESVKSNPAKKKENSLGLNKVASIHAVSDKETNGKNASPISEKTSERNALINPPVLHENAAPDHSSTAIHNNRNTKKLNSKTTLSTNEDDSATTISTSTPRGEEVNRKSQLWLPTLPTNFPTTEIAALPYPEKSALAEKIFSDVETNTENENANTLPPPQP